MNTTMAKGSPATPMISKTSWRPSGETHRLRLQTLHKGTLIKTEQRLASGEAGTAMPAQRDPDKPLLIA